MEVFLLKNLHQSHIIKYSNIYINHERYLDFYQDELFAYLVMEIHGTPSNTKSPILTSAIKHATKTHSIVKPQIVRDTATLSNSLKQSQSRVNSHPITNSEIESINSSSSRRRMHEPSNWKHLTINTDTRENPAYRKNITYPLFGLLEKRTSTDLFECIEQKKKLNEGILSECFINKLRRSKKCVWADCGMHLLHA